MHRCAVSVYCQLSPVLIARNHKARDGQAELMWCDLIELITNTDNKNTWPTEESAADSDHRVAMSPDRYPRHSLTTP